jgi:hypothetical protein
MSPILLVALRKWRELRPGGPDDLVFATRRKKPLSDGNLLKRYVYPAFDRLKTKSDCIELSKEVRAFHENG